MSHPEANLPATLPVRSELEALLSRLAEVDTPVVSLYLDVHADADPNAPAQRANAALRHLSLERDVRERLELRLSEALRDVGEGTLVFIAAEDGDASTEALLVRVAPPIPGGADPAAARWGSPWTTPLALLLASEAPVVAVFADERRARVFVHDLGEATEASAYVRALDPSGWRRYQEAETGMPGTVARGGSGKDDFEARKDAWTKRFQASVVERVETTVAARPGTRLLLLGEARRRNELEEALSAPLQRALLASTAAPVDPDLPPSAWSEPLTATIRDAVRAEDEQLLRRLERDGTTGLAQVLTALQQGELEWIAVPAGVDVDVVHCLGTGWIAENEELARAVCPDGPFERAPFKRFLLPVAQRGRAGIRLLRGPDADEFVRRFGPVAGLPRRS